MKLEIWRGLRSTLRGGSASWHWRTAWRQTAVLGMVCLLTACSVTLGPDSEHEIQRQRAIWRAQRIDSYTAEVRRMCFCGWVGWVKVTVENGEIVAKEPLEDPPEYGDFLQYIPDIDGLFEILIEAENGNADTIDVKWSDEYGFPSEVFIDYEENTADEEQAFAVRRFEPRR